MHVLLLSDQSVEELTGEPPHFPQEERRYFVQAVRLRGPADPGRAVGGSRRTAGICLASRPATWVVDEAEDRATSAVRVLCGTRTVIRRDPGRPARRFPPLVRVPSRQRQHRTSADAKRSLSPAATTGCTPGTCGSSRRSRNWASCMWCWATMRTSHCSRGQAIRCTDRTNGATWWERFVTCTRLHRDGRRMAGRGTRDRADPTRHLRGE